jgi:hypothetical protein
MESAALKQRMVKVAGEELHAAGKTFYGIPGFSLERFYRGEDSVYSTQRQNFLLQLTTEVFRDVPVTEGLQITMSDTTFTYTFTVENWFPETLGWMIVKVLYKGKAYV